MIEDIQTSNVSTVGSSQSGLSSQSPAIQVIIREQVEAQMTRLRSKTTKLRRLYNELLSNLGATCSLPRHPHGPDEDPPLSPPPSPPPPAFVL
jgi:hypothetical protein